MKELIKRFEINVDEFMKLKNIGGHSIYHLEGDALEHTRLVWIAASNLTNSKRFQKLALLHDIGKIYTSIEKSPGNWEYPDHSTCGSFRGILAKFIPQNDPDFVNYQWLIKNHIKPLFWREKGVNTDDTGIDVSKLDKDFANLYTLKLLAICDLLGSKAKDEDAKAKLIDYIDSLKV